MGEGEQRTIHPFFTKNYNASSHSTDGSASSKESHVAAGDNTTSENANQPTQNRPDNSVHGTHVKGDAVQCHGSYNETYREQWPIQQVLPAVRPMTPQGTTLDEDPNSSRRKRRKTEPLEDLVTLQDGQQERGQPASDSTGSAETVQLSDQISGPTGTVLHLQNNAGMSTVHASIPEDPNVLHPPNDEPYTTSSLTTPPKKTLKLNANGKLLSSPPADNTDAKGQKKGGGKRKSMPKKKKEQESKIVVMKYGATESPEGIGKLINTILAGEHRHVARPRLNPSASKEKPQKPTHPFFLGKSARRTELSPGPSSIQQSAQTDSPSVSADRQPHRPLSDRPQKPFPLFSKSAFVKVPDPVEPLWPPQQFAHVRGLEGGTGGQFTGPSELQPDRRKAKTSVVSIDDSENVLLARLHKARTSPTSVDRAALRIPKRHVASGVVLEKAMQSQLSDNMPSITGQVSTPPKTYHPAISRLKTSIRSTMTPFDKGECETLPWTQKYAPVCAEDVLQVGPEAVMLRDWLRRLTISAVDTGKESQKSKQGKGEAGGKRTKRRKRADKLDGFIVSSSDEASEMDEVTDPEEDELAGGVTFNSKRTVIRAGDVQGRPREKTRLTNTVLLSGPSGCGKTASVYAAAKELDFEIFEINASSRRSARDIIEKVGDMTQNHLVHRLNEIEGTTLHADSDTAKQNKVNSFFKAAAPKAKASEQEKEGKKRATETPPRASRSQKQSLILLEEADLLFEEDKQFWTGVVTLISQSKRPIIITCNDEKLIPLEELSLHAILRYRMPPRPLAVDYLLLIAANEGHMLSRDAVMDLYSVAKKDLRRALTELDFWCQMAVGSEKSGLDWIVDRYPPGRDVDAHGNTVRAVSLNTYQRFMGWFSRDAILEKDEPGTEIELMSESQAWWQLSIQDSEEMVDPSSFQLDSERVGGNASLISLESLRRIDDAVEMRSALDILCHRGSLQPNEDYLDTSYPPMTEKQRTNYIEGYPLLQADTMPDYTWLSTSIGSTLDVFTRRFYYGTTSDSEDLTGRKVLKKASQVQPPHRSRMELLAAFEPIMRADNVFPMPTGRLAPSFENGMGVVYEDLAPYIRGIIAFDLRLERYRLELSGLLSQGSGSTKRARTTRASRAALEGGDKANTRKERWFPADVQPNRILATGNEEWQKVLVQSGHFNIAPMAPGTAVEERRGSAGSASESSGDGGF
ncbi:hypothetical protein Plec18167_001836 [Paecilomyces lecythidis]|uniref:AAA+ ATPase domain-containing protein n=1 Tax=Paecilomyces lecythidis TaxID=3004212 RepID=A0ABR3YAS6_9EURO